MSTLADFISRVVPWPGEQSPGVVNLHWTTPNPRDPNGKPFWSGKPTRTPDEFVRMTEWAKARPSIRDIYFCTSLQGRAGTNAKGKAKVLRSAADALSVKAIWLDIDVKDPPKGYPTLGEALDELQRLIKMAQLPPPSALIASGGGLHVYWISNRILTVDEWRPFAEGLKAAAIKYQLRCDAGCTSDIARILRVPNTFNYKTTPPRAVRVLGQLGKDIDFETELASIKQVVTATVTVPAPTSFLAGKPDPAFLAAPVEKIGAGVDHVDSTPLDAVPMIKECPFFRDAYQNGGKDHNQPLWNLTILATTFLDRGEHLAHKLGNKHPGYDAKSTDDMYQRKVREQAERDLGWPSCSKFQGEGSKFCAGCKYFGQIKSPLNLAGRTQQVQLAVPQGTSPASPANQLHLPKGYIIDPEGYVSSIEEIPQDEGGVPETVVRRIFTCKLGRPHVQHDPDMLCYTATADMGNITSVYVPFEAMATNADLCRSLLKHKVTYESRNKALLEHFHMAWTTKLHNIMKASKPQPMGWYFDKGQIRGFCYGGAVLKDDGTEEPSGFGDKSIQGIYAPAGSLQNWYDCAKIVTDQQRPEMDALLAQGFAAPLITATGQNAGLFSVWGESGARKSFAVDTALAIWGHPKKSKEVVATTYKSAVGKLGNINNLPLVWDEIKDEETQKKVYDTVYMATQGVGPGRLKSDTTQRDRDTWQTMITICANRSFVDYVAKRDKVTDAGLLRVFEYHVAKAPPGSPGEIMPHHAANMGASLFHNYGLMGVKYAKYLALNHGPIIAAMNKLQDEIYNDLNGRPEERFWFAIVSSLIMGAKLANDMGCNINVERLRPFLIAQLQKNRGRHKDEALVGGTVMNTEEHLTTFLKEFSEHQIWTNTYHVGRGKPRPVSVIWGPRQDLNRAIQIQWVVQDRLLRISKRTFVDWSHKNDISPMQLMRGFKDNFNADTAFARLASGTPYRGGQEHLIDIPIPPGSDLEPQLFAHSNETDIAAVRKLDEEKAAEKASLTGGTIAAAIAKSHEQLEIATKTIH